MIQLKLKTKIFYIFLKWSPITLYMYSVNIQLFSEIRKINVRCLYLRSLNLIVKLNFKMQPTLDEPYVNYPIVDYWPDIYFLQKLSQTLGEDE